MPEIHTGLNISNIINNIGQEFGITSTNIPYVTDSASNMKLAFKNSKWFPCMLHRLHTSISKAWELTSDEDQEIQILYSRMLKVSSFFST
ncbi:MAG: Zinc finger BED domain-containing protein 1 [Marteilia pararefringens]